MDKLIILAIVLVCLIIILRFFRNKIQTQDQLTAHNAKALILNCMDFRLIDDYVKYFDSIGYNNNYDNFILAGSSLGYNQTTYPDWKKSFETHIDLAIKLHHINEVIIVDHLGCGAYKIFYNNPNLTKSEELTLHQKELTKAKIAIEAKYKDHHIKVRTFIMDIDGSIKEFIPK